MKIGFMFLFSLFFMACTTSGKFIIPEGSKLYVHERPVTPDANGIVTMKPMFWTAAGVPPSGGAKYRLEKDGKEIKRGRLRVAFRPVSIFWPPFALIYWPMGFNSDITYDLVKDPGIK